MYDVKFYEKLNELDLYFKEVRKFKSLSKKEEAELSVKIKNGDENALNKLVNANLKFVITIAKGYRNTGICFSDLISEGNIGLMKAARRFDGKKGVKFISYAIWWVRSEIQEYINKIIGRNEVETDVFDINTKNRGVAIDVTDNGDDDEYYESFAEESDANMINVNSSIQELMESLCEREKKILMLYYGLNSGNGMTLEEIGEQMNLTSERVRQIKDKAIVKMKCTALMSDEFETLSSLI